MWVHGHGHRCVLTVLEGFACGLGHGWRFCGFQQPERESGNREVDCTLHSRLSIKSCKSCLSVQQSLPSNKVKQSVCRGHGLSTVLFNLLCQLHTKLNGYKKV